MATLTKFDSPLGGRSGVGVTIGKFMPLHKGHELMIEMAAAELEELVVIVSDERGMERDPRTPDLYVRYKIIQRKYAGYDNIRVVWHRDDYGPAQKYDEQGTAVDDAFWAYWVNVFKVLAPDASYIVSSDHYGNEMAHRCDVQWFPIDPGRELFGVSGTAIRKDPIANWAYIAREFRPYYAKKIVALGAESSGKSTLIRDLGKYFNSPAVPEYGRILSEVKPELDEDDFFDIVRRHEFMIKKACMESETGLVFVDTEKLVTWMYGKLYLDKDINEIRSRVRPEEFDLWVMIPPNLPWVDDGTRVQPDQTDRLAFFYELMDCTNPSKFYRHRREATFNRMVLDETDREKRVQEVGAEVLKLIGRDTAEYRIQP